MPAHTVYALREYPCWWNIGLHMILSRVLIRTLCSKNNIQALSKSTQYTSPFILCKSGNCVGGLDQVGDSETLFQCNI